MAKTTKRPVPATQFPGEKPVEQTVSIESAPLPTLDQLSIEELRAQMATFDIVLPDQLTHEQLVEAFSKLVPALVSPDELKQMIAAGERVTPTSIEISGGKLDLIDGTWRLSYPPLEALTINANPESVASENETAAADPDVIVITGDSTNPPAANPESLELPIVEQHIEPEPVVYQPDGPDNAAGAPKGVHLEHLTVPVKRSLGYAPTAISLNLTGAQARMLANIAEGLTACGEKLAHPSDAINLILDHLADND